MVSLLNVLGVGLGIGLFIGSFAIGFWLQGLAKKRGDK